MDPVGIVENEIKRRQLNEQEILHWGSWFWGPISLETL